MKHFFMTLPGRPVATLEGYLLDCYANLGQYEKRPAILVCPGGGYVYCARSEGEPVAMAYAARGFHTFVLRYSTGRAAGDFQPQLKKYCSRVTFSEKSLRRLAKKSIK